MRALLSYAEQKTNMPKMTRAAHCLSALCVQLITISALLASPQAVQSQPQAAQGTFTAGAEEVSLDLIARDKKGQFVRDLKPDDLEIYDNGSKRAITSFRLIEGGSAVVSATTQNVVEKKQQLDPLMQVRLITLLFSNLADVNDRRLCRNAALDLLKMEFPANVYMAVLVLDQNLEALQAFTNDRELLKKAVEKATGASYTQFHEDSVQIQNQLQQTLGPATAGESPQEQINNMAPGGNTGPSGATSAQSGPSVAMAQMLLNMLQLAQRSELAQSGRASIYGLLSAVRQQYMLPGRKSIFFFSEGFSVPQGSEEAFKTVISTANRFNVSFYAIDARGLASTTMNGESISELRDAAAASRAQFGRNSGNVNVQKAQALDRAMDAGKANTQNTLAELATSTGGSLIANTNDFRGPLRRAVDDTETYYEVTYNPGIEKYDGTFRKIDLKTDRAGVRLQSRAGYFALPRATGDTGVVLAPYEVPLLNALSVKPSPHDFDFHSAGLHFRAGDASKCAVVLDLPFNSMTFQRTDAKPAKGERNSAPVYNVNFAYIVLVKDSKGQIVRNFRGDVPLQPAETQLNALRASHFIYSQTFDLAPGRYTLETAMLDRIASKVSARRSVLVMPAVAPLGISSVSIVRSLRDRDDSTPATDPFLISNRIVTPTLSGLQKSLLSQGLSFYLVIYTDPRNQAKPSLTMQFSRDGQPVGAGSPELGKADEQGRIQYIATAPVDSMQPGNYEVQFTARQGNQAAAQSVTFTLE